MDAIALLRKDHQAVEDLFSQFEKARSADRKKAIVAEITQELEIHTQIEEQIFYPAYKDAAAKDGQELVAEAYEEHNVAKRLMEELGELTPDDEAFEAKVTVLQEAIEHHVEEEHKEMFPDAKKRLGDDLTSLGERMMEMKEQLSSKATASRR